MHTRRTHALVPVAAAFLLVLPDFSSVEAQTVTRLTDLESGMHGVPTLDDDGSAVFAATSSDPFGTNPAHAWQIGEWDPTNGTGALLTGYADGVSTQHFAVSVGDDGTRVAFVSPANPTGQNQDESPEVFIMDSGGSNITQLTDDPGPTGGAIYGIALSGSANRVVFTATTDPLGTNPSNLRQVFVVDADGMNLRQLTSGAAEIDPVLDRASISDDGTRIVFAHEGNPLGTNNDGTHEIFAINHDGTGLRQLTTSFGGSWEPVISGDGTKVVFSSADPHGFPSLSGNIRLYTINWDGTGLQRVTDPLQIIARQPWIGDDGGLVVFSGQHEDPVVNPDDVYEIWKVTSSGTGLTQLTASPALSENRFPVISGDASRIAYLLNDLSAPFVPERQRLRVMDDGGGSVFDLVTGNVDEVHMQVDITPDGSRIVFSSDGDLTGSGSSVQQIYRIEADGNGLTQVTSFTDGHILDPGVTADGSTIVFVRNPEVEVMAIEADGTGLRQLSTDQGAHPVIAGNGSYVVFQSGAGDLFRVLPDGSGMLQITADADTIRKHPRIDQSGDWVVYHSAESGAMQVYRVRSDGTSPQQITSDATYAAQEPDVSGSGNEIVYVSWADPLGTNADHNPDVFLHDVAAAVTQQLTFTTGTGCSWPRISKDGAYVYFLSQEAIFEGEPHAPWEIYRVHVVSGSLERVGSLKRGLADIGTVSWRTTRLHAVDGDGDRAVFAPWGENVVVPFDIVDPPGKAGDWTGTNADLSHELYLVDFSAPASIEVSAPTPTVVRWDPEPRPRRYDVIRGDVASLSQAGAEVDLGPVVCLENDSPDNETVGSEDAVAPAPGQAFFYLYRGTQGALDPDNPGSYGQGTGGPERVAGAGDCGP